MGQLGWKMTSQDGEYVLLVYAESDLRPGTVYEWAGNVLIDQEGRATIHKMYRETVEGEPRKDETPEMETPGPPAEPGAIRNTIEQIARACLAETARNEELLARRMATRARTDAELEAIAREDRKEVQLDP